MKAMMMRVATLGCCGLLLPAVLTSTSAAAWGFFGSPAEEVHPKAQSHKHLPDFRDGSVKRLLSSEDVTREEPNNSSFAGQISPERVANDSSRRLSEQLAFDLNSVQGATSESTTRQTSSISAIPPEGRANVEANADEASVVRDTGGKATRRLTMVESSDKRTSVPEDPRRLGDDTNVRGSVEREWTGHDGNGEASRYSTEIDRLANENNQRRLQGEGDVTLLQSAVDSGGGANQKSGIKASVEEEHPSSEVAHNVTRLLSEVGGQGETDGKVPQQLSSGVASGSVGGPSADNAFGSSGDGASRQLSALRGFSGKSDIGIVSAAPTALNTDEERTGSLPLIFDVGGGKGRRRLSEVVAPKNEEIASIATPDSTRRLAEVTDLRGAVKYQNPSGTTTDGDMGGMTESRVPGDSTV